MPNILIGIIFIISGIISAVHYVYYLMHDDCPEPWIIVNGMFTVIIFVTLGFQAIANPEERPQAIDVYRNKTELSITKTIKDNTITKCDSVVIWKSQSVR